MVPYKSTYLISAKSRCKYNLCSIWSKLNHTVRSYCKKCDPIPLKSIVAVESNCLSITDCNFLFHHCTLARNALPTTRNILRVKIVTSHLGLFFSIKWPMVLGPTFVNEYGRGGIFVNCMMSNIYNNGMRCMSFYNLKGPSNKSIHLFKKNIVRDIVSKTVLKVKICEKYKISYCYSFC